VADVQRLYDHAVKQVEAAKALGSIKKQSQTI
jgi:hypothetical protein